jgi:pSer/pThr/pTyr-binding forkhead associated (FHA) protein
MFDPQDLSEYMMAHLDSSPEDVQNNLKLFQSFKRVYDQNPALVSELLGLEQNNGQGALRLGHVNYVVGLVTERIPLLITNISRGRSQIFLPCAGATPIWVIGRDPGQASLVVRDGRLSRCHAAIHYDKSSGFMVSDLGSKNGTHVNGVRMLYNSTLQDGDHVRLGGFSFRFAEATEFRRPPAPDQRIIRQIEGASIPPTTPIQTSEPVPEAQNAPNLDETIQFMRRSPHEPKPPSPQRRQHNDATTDTLDNDALHNGNG